MCVGSHLAIVQNSGHDFVLMEFSPGNKHVKFSTGIRGISRENIRGFALQIGPSFTTETTWKVHGISRRLHGVFICGMKILWSISHGFPLSPHGKFNMFISPWKFHGVRNRDRYSAVQDGQNNLYPPIFTHTQRSSTYTYPIPSTLVPIPDRKTATLYSYPVPYCPKPTSVSTQISLT